MRKMADRLEIFEKSVGNDNAPAIDMRKATDAQLESYLTSCGMDPNGVVALQVLMGGDHQQTTPYISDS